MDVLIKIGCLLPLSLLIAACNPERQETKQEKGRLLAEAYGSELLLSDLSAYMPENADPADSQQIIHSMTDAWVREQLLLAEAKENLPEELELDRLVEDYRNSLMLHYYEQLLIENLLDSTIDKSEYRQVYERQKGQFELQQPLYRIRYMRVDQAGRHGRYANWWRDWEDSGRDSLLINCGPPGCRLLASDSIWYTRSEVSALFPPDYNWESGRDALVFAEGGADYYFEIMKKLEEGETAPLSYVIPRLRKLILHERTLSLLETVRRDLYQRALKNNDLKIYIE